MIVIDTLSELAEVVRQGPFTFPGGYPIFFVTADGGILSFEAVADNYKLVARAVLTETDTQWRVTGCDINWEADLYCDHYEKAIPSAYGD